MFLDLTQETFLQVLGKTLKVWKTDTHLQEVLLILQTLIEAHQDVSLYCKMGIVTTHYSLFIA